MGRGGLGLALIVAIGAALLVAPLLLKASEYLRGYRPHALTATATGHDEVPVSFHNGRSDTL